MMLWIALAGLLFASSLQDAIRSNNLSDLQAALDAGARVNEPDGLGSTPLHDAAWLGRTEMVKLLLAHGANVNARHTEGGSTPLHFAAVQSNAPLARLLLENKADVTAGNSAGSTSLQIAAHGGHMELLAVLLEYTTDDGSALAEAERPSTVAFLLAHVRYGVSTLTERLTEAVQRSEPEVVRLLLDHGADPKAPGVLHSALQRGSHEITRALLEAGGDANATDAGGIPILQEAALRDDPVLIRAFAKHGARVNAVDPEAGSTALYVAASMGKVNAVRALLEAGADPSLPTKSGRTPLRAAQASGFQAIADLLR